MKKRMPANRIPGPPRTENACMAPTVSAMMPAAIGPMM